MPGQDPHPRSWRTSTRTNASGANCVEVASTINEVAVRDTKNRQTGHLSMTPHDWLGLLSFVKTRYDSTG